MLPSQVLRQITTRHQQNQFSRALAEFGRIYCTEFMLRWIAQPELRRDVQVMLNKGEMGHILSDSIRIHRQGNIMDRTRSGSHAEAVEGITAVVTRPARTNVFHLIGLDMRGAIILKSRLSRCQLENFLANLPSCLIGMEACSGAHNGRPPSDWRVHAS